MNGSTIDSGAYFTKWAHNGGIITISFNDGGEVTSASFVNNKGIRNQLPVASDDYETLVADNKDFIAINS